MVRPSFIDQNGMKKGAWSKDEDDKLKAYVLRYGHWNWRLLPNFAGLARCGKSCRLRWMNYLKPDLKRGDLTKEEEDLIIELHNQLGNKWSTIAKKLPGRTDNEIKNYWHNNAKRRNKPNINRPTKVREAKATENTPSHDHQIQTLSQPQNLISHQIQTLSQPPNLISSPNIPNLIAYDTTSLHFTTLCETFPPINTYNSPRNIVPEPNESSSELNFSELSFQDFPILSALDWIGDDSVNSSDCNHLMENFWNELNEASYVLPSVEGGGNLSAPYSSSFGDFMMDML